jgi:hypothetical protein
MPGRPPAAAARYWPGKFLDSKLTRPAAPDSAARSTNAWSSPLAAVGVTKPCE